MRACVHVDSLGVIVYRGCFPKSVYKNGERTDEQKTTAAGIPVWSLSANVIQPDSDRPEQMRFELASKKDPSEGLERGDHISFDDVWVRWFVFANENNKLVQSWQAEGVHKVAE